MRSIFAVLTLIAATSAEAQSCGGSFANFVDDLKAEARAMGYPAGAVDAFRSSEGSMIGPEAASE